MQSSGAQLGQPAPRGSIAAAPAPVRVSPDVSARAAALTRALGGRQNIKQIEPVAVTRLRVRIGRATAVDDAALTAAGALGVQRIADDLLHVIVGNRADEYAAAMAGGSRVGRGCVCFSVWTVHSQIVSVPLRGS